MPCQCGNTMTAASDADTTYAGCECGTESGGDCACGGGSPTPSDRHQESLERVVMELDKRVRKLEASR